MSVCFSYLCYCQPTRHLQVYWSGTGSLVAIIADDSFYILRFDRDAYNSKLDQGVELADDGVEEAFDVVSEVPDRYVSLFCQVDEFSLDNYSVKTAKWIGDCFIYTTGANRLNYFVGTDSYTISPFDQYVPFIAFLSSF